MKGRMTMRERMLAVVAGHEHDRVPFVQYGTLAAANEEIWSVLGRDAMGILGWASLYRFEHPNCHFESVDIARDGRQGIRRTLYTPVGTLTEERTYQPTYGVGAIRRHYVRRPEDYGALMAYLRDLVVLDNYDEIELTDHKLGDDGLCHVAVPRTPYQQLWVEWVSLEDLALHLVDCPEIVHDCISLLTEVERKVFRLVSRARISYVVVPDNITAPVIGEKRFREYCLPLYQELSDIAAEVGIPVYAHLDGDLKPLWKAIGESGLCGIDSLSPPPNNDTPVAQAVAMWPHVRLGVNFPSSVHLAPSEAIYATTRQILEEGGRTGRLQIQISENVPPGVWRKSFPQIVTAIQDFGRPV